MSTTIDPITPANVPADNTDTSLQPRFIGPVGNRVAAVAGIPGDHLTYYAGAASGGIFKTTDGGTTWIPVFDQQAGHLQGQRVPEKVSSIGALAVAESNPNIVWAGTGESWIRGPISIGNGVYKSLDGGANWTRMGLIDSGRIAKVCIHPDDPDVVWIAAMGSCYEDVKNQERGIYKTTDGGLTWAKCTVPDTNENTGCCDLVVDYNNPAILYAGMWEFSLRSWNRKSGGPGSGVYKSVDGGDTWKELTNGLPTGPNENGKTYVVGKVSVGVAKSDSNYVYANIETGDGEPTEDFPDPANGQLWQSTDAGESWTLQNYSRNINSRAAYYNRNAVSTDNKHEAYFLAPFFSVTIDGGKTIDSQGEPVAPGGDHHEMWIDPGNGNRMAVVHDQGFSITENRGQTWRKIQLPIAQIYEASVDDRTPYYVFGNAQDRVGTWGPSNSRTPVSIGLGLPGAGNITRGMWLYAGGGECGYTIPDPKHKDLIWSSGASDGPNGGAVALLNRATGHWRMITVKPDQTTGTPPKDVQYRFHWHFPLTISPYDDTNEKNHRVYAGSQYVHVSDDLGQSWHLISDELSHGDEFYLKDSGGLTSDNLNVRMAYVTSYIAESPLTPGQVWVGTSDQRLWVGQKLTGFEYKWTELADKIPHLPDPVPGVWALVSCISPSLFEKDTAYVTFDRHQAADTASYVYKVKLTGTGSTWTKITNGIPQNIVSYVQCIAQDPGQQGLLFLGTQNGLYVSFNDGQKWEILPGLPPVPVSGVVVQEHFSDLVISTFGRGFWIYDDINPLRQLVKPVADDAYLFKMPRPMYRFQNIIEGFIISPGNDPCIGQDPPSPAPINFYLKKKTDKDNISLTISEGEKVIRTIDQLSGVEGINRVWWDLNTDATTTLKLRTHPDNQKGTQYCPSGIRPYSNAIVGGALSWWVAPGRYKVQLLIDKKPVGASQEIHVVRDPTSRPELNDAAFMEVLDQQSALNNKIKAAVNRLADDVNTLEFIRAQLMQLKERVPDHDALKLIDAFELECLAVETRFIQVRLTGEGEDLARFPAGLLEQLVYLGSIIATGDYMPTGQMCEQFETLKRKLDAANDAFQKALASVPRFNDQLHNHNIAAGVLTDPPNSEVCALFDSGPAF